MKTISIDRLHELFHCDAQTGLLKWKITRGRKAAGATAGCLHKVIGYVTVNIDGQQFMAHRVVWAMVHGAWPSKLIDHINGKRSDNRPINLREADHSENSSNRQKAALHNKTGLLGARYHKRAKRFVSTITRNGKKTHLGYFDTAELAHAAYLAAKECAA